MRFRRIILAGIGTCITATLHAITSPHPPCSEVLDRHSAIKRDERLTGPASFALSGGDVLVVWLDFENLTIHQLLFVNPDTGFPNLPWELLQTCTTVSKHRVPVYYLVEIIKLYDT